MKARVSSGRSIWWIVLLTVACTLVSLGVTFSMIVGTYPGDECLLFVGVRGEALIYGNPAGCNFVAYGHAIMIAGSVVMLFLLFCHRCRSRKGFLKRKRRASLSNRSLRGSTSSIVQQRQQPQFINNYWNEPSEQGFATGRFSRFHSSKPILLALLLATFSLVTALVAISGYFVTCEELEYEAQRQINQRLTLGKPFKNLAIRCWSLFRDHDFHTRFHFDHYEYKGLWHGQYRGYEHGKVHRFDTKHVHVIGVALALELSISGTWISTLFWFAVLSLMVHLRRRAHSLKQRELAESLEDARIFASSRQVMDGGGVPLGSIMMNTFPIEQANQSCAVDQPMFPNHSTLVRGEGAGRQSQSLAGYPAAMRQLNTPTSIIKGSAPVLQEQIMTQQQTLSHQMRQMQLMQQQNQQNDMEVADANFVGGNEQPIRYVHLSDGTLVPTMASHQQQQHQNWGQQL